MQSPIIYTVKDLADRDIKVPIIDPLFNAAVVSQTEMPNSLIWRAMHQDYSAEQVLTVPDNLDEKKCGEIAVKKLLKGGSGHFGPLEHPSITFSIGYFPHAVMQQARTHRISVSFDVQSFRYTSDSLLKAAVEPMDIAAVEKAFYIRPIGSYTDRKGQRYIYTKEMRYAHLLRAWDAAKIYKHDHIVDGLTEEHARSSTLFDYRQHWIVTFNARSAFHFLDLRAKADAAPEIRTLCEIFAIPLKLWIPEIFGWYEENRFRKARLAP